jgi:hypothetical protein
MREKNNGLYIAVRRRVLRASAFAHWAMADGSADLPAKGCSSRLHLPAIYRAPDIDDVEIDVAAIGPTARAASIGENPPAGQQQPSADNRPAYCDVLRN